MNYIEQLILLNLNEDFLIAAAIIIGGTLLARIIRRIIKKRLDGTDGLYVRFFLRLEEPGHAILVLLSIYAGLSWLNIPADLQKPLAYILTVAFIFLLIRLITAVVRAAIVSYLHEQDKTGEKVREVRGLVVILNCVLWVIGLLFLFDNMGFNVTAVLTGLGVGGIAIALAAQTILGDIFNYFVIFFDRPFERGDFVVIDDKMGTIDYIGLKTTRIKSLHGEQIIFNNSNLAGSRIHNYKRMEERRVLFRLGVTYDTGGEKLKRIPEILKNVIDGRELVRFDRAHFAAYAEYSLQIEVVYFILSADYRVYMDIQHAINLAIYEEFGKQGIRFALPTYVIDGSGSRFPDTSFR